MLKTPWSTVCASPRITPKHLAWKISGVHSHGCTGGSRVPCPRKCINVNEQHEKGDFTAALFSSTLSLSPPPPTSTSPSNFRRDVRVAKTSLSAASAKQKYRRCNSERAPLLQGLVGSSPWRIYEPAEATRDANDIPKLSNYRYFPLNVFKRNFTILINKIINIGRIYHENIFV